MFSTRRIQLIVSLLIGSVLILLTALIFSRASAMPARQDDPDAGGILAAVLAEENTWDGVLRRIRVPILMYHYISAPPEDADEFRIGLSVPPELFRTHMEHLRFSGYTPISLYQLNAALMTGQPLPPKPVVLTFDDGYIDHYTQAFPILREYGFTATFFIITGRADANDPNYLSWTQISEMASAGMSMESHTKDHLDLRGRDYDFLIYQMLGSMESLLAYTGRQTRFFSYPSGQYDANTLAVLRRLPVWRAVTTQPGVLHTTDNTLEMTRLRVTNTTSVEALEDLLQRST